MSLFSEADRERIADAIRRAEQRTSGEIVAIVARESDSYRFIALLWASLIALSLPLVVILAPRLTQWRFAFQGPETLYLMQLVLFIVLALLLQLPALRHALTPWPVKKARAHQRAMQQFIAQDLHSTEQRTGVMIFVSVAEHYVEILADTRIAQKVDPYVWRKTVDELTAAIGAGRPGDGFIAAIEACGEVLAEHFPPGDSNSDELPNHLIEIN